MSYSYCIPANKEISMIDYVNRQPRKLAPKQENPWIAGAAFVLATVIAICVVLMLGVQP